jgi:hypothetical protein
MQPHPERDHGPGRDARRAWEAPRVVDLPRLIRLTLQTGDQIPGGGTTGGSGSTVVP